jgi:hypothetical protein
LSLGLVVGWLHRGRSLEAPRTLKMSVMPSESATFVASSLPAISLNGTIWHSPPAPKDAFNCGCAISTRWPRALPGAGGANDPFWSPDSRAIAFFARGKLRKADLAGGPPMGPCWALQGCGSAWSSMGAIVFAPNTSRPL